METDTEVTRYFRKYNYNRYGSTEVPKVPPYLREGTCTSGSTSGKKILIHWDYMYSGYPGFFLDIYSGVVYFLLCVAMDGSTFVLYVLCSYVLPEVRKYFRKIDTKVQYTYFRTFIEYWRAS